jgi:hypothetical protein
MAVLRQQQPVTPSARPFLCSALALVTQTTTGWQWAVPRPEHCKLDDGATPRAPSVVDLLGSVDGAVTARFKAREIMPALKRGLPSQNSEPFHDEQTTRLRRRRQTSGGRSSNRCDPK